MNIPKITRKLKYDVVVVGAGTAGVFAAISAARCGAKTLLIEKNCHLGGTMTAANVNFPGLFFAWGKQIISGPGWESIEKTIAHGGAVLPPIPYKPERHWHTQIRLNPFVYSAVLFEMCGESGVHLLTNCMISAAEESETQVSLLCTDKNGLLEIEAKTAIDATGDATLVSMAGYPVEKSPVQQPATLQNSLSGYDMENVRLEEIEEKFPTSGLKSPVTPQKLYGWLKIGRLDLHTESIDADTSKGRTELEMKAFAQMLKILDFLRQISGLENLCIASCAAETGVRETNRIIGEKTVTAQDYISGAWYEDAVCYAYYPIDLHVMGGIEQTHFKEEVVAKVPYGALIPKNSKRLLAAGRCLSSDAYANSGLRVEAVCMATGQVCGCAAALACRQDTLPREVSYPLLVDTLKKLGAIVPEK